MPLRHSCPSAPCWTGVGPRASGSCSRGGRGVGSFPWAQHSAHTDTARSPALSSSEREGSGQSWNCRQMSPGRMVLLGDHSIWQNGPVGPWGHLGVDWIEVAGECLPTERPLLVTRAVTCLQPGRELSHQDARGARMGSSPCPHAGSWKVRFAK